MILYLKLRNNISLEGDIELAKREIEHLFDDISEVRKTNLANFSMDLPQQHILSFTRDADLIGFIVSNNKCSIERCIHLLSFIQEIWYKYTDVNINNLRFCRTIGNYICIVPLMAMSEFLFYSTYPSDLMAESIVDVLIGHTSNKEVKQVIKRAITSAPHVHSLHTYKAKFFPRFVRSLIVSNLDLNANTVSVCDPYMGSATTLVECSLLGLDSTGIDIDPLSCFISQAKVDAMEMNEGSLSYNSFFQHSLIGEKAQYIFPKSIIRKFERWNILHEMESYQQEISKELDLIESDSIDYKKLHKIALSDALTRKFNVRMMGTGSGRFALEIAKAPLSSLLSSNMRNSIKAVKTIEVIKSIYGISLKRPKVYEGNATRRQYDDDSFDIIVTSPPYLPASSGREDYLTGKMISLKALGLASDETFEAIQSNSVGSMDNMHINTTGLPDSVMELYIWLANDELRSIKATPVLAYYNSIRDSLIEDKRTIKENGRIIYIIGKESIFYKMATKEILYKVECDRMFKEIAETVGLRVVDSIDIELDKKNAVARPRSTDKYYETAIILSK